MSKKPFEESRWGPLYLDLSWEIQFPLISIPGRLELHPAVQGIVEMHLTSSGSKSGLFLAIQLVDHSLVLNTINQVEMINKASH